MYVHYLNACTVHQMELQVLKSFLKTMQRFLKKRPASQLDPDTSSSESGASAVTSATSSKGDRRRDSEAATSNKRRKSGDCRRLWHSEWETTYLVSYDSKTDTCTCLKCNNRIDTVKKYNLQTHCESMHPDTKEWSDEKRKLFVQQAK